MKNAGFFLRKISYLLFLVTNTVCAQGVYQMWGTSREGGVNNIGSIFSTSSNGSNLQTRHSLLVKNSGSTPKYSELVEYNGNFYGTTTAGGLGYGTIFQWNATTNECTVKYSFTGTDGRSPHGTIALYNGKFYGTTVLGGANNLGVIFEWDPVTNIYTKKIDFSSAAGASPYGGMKLYNDKFYGLTTNGGTTNEGTIYEWDPATNIHTKKIDITSSTLGALPFGSLVFNGSTFYATAKYGVTGAGVILEWNPATNVCTKKYEFVYANGAYPYNDLTFYNGSYFGLTTSGGLYNAGVIFEWNPSTNVYTKRFDFSGAADSGPQSHFTVVGNKLYAVSYYGGGNSYGFVFEWDPVANQMNYKSSFDNSTGRQPFSSLTLSSDGKLFSTTAAGGAEDVGTIFEWSPAANAITTKVSFSVNEGKYPYGTLVRDGNKLYGVTKNGGDNGTGAIFEWDLSTGAYTTKASFTSTVSPSIRYPSGTLVKYGTNYYGLSETGGTTLNNGTIFQWDPVTNALTQMQTFTGTNGQSPLGSMTLYGNKLYGMTSQGGSGNTGTIFEWNPATNTLTKKIDLSGSNGKYPYSDLILYGTKFYGMTWQGGTNNAGVIFEWDPATNVYTKKIDLSSTNGSNPYGNLTLYNNKFYGLTNTGGTGSDGGVIFEWDPATNVYTRKYSFSINSIDGSTPYGTLTMNGGKFYGVTYKGGAAGRGVLFEWDPATNTYTKKADLGYPGAAWPRNTELLLVPASVSAANPGACVSLNSITIDASNANSWVPITDSNGDVVAEIKPNGNILGTVTPGIYVHNGSPRESSSKQLYLNRNITLQVQNQPASPVDLRFYIKKTELEVLKNATNSQGLGTGITGINDLSVLKAAGTSCTDLLSEPVESQSTTTETWGDDYVLKASVNSLSTFYFAAAVQLPVPSVDNIGNKCANAPNASAKISNPPAGSTITITQDGNAINYVPTDSSFQYFVSGVTSAGNHTITVKFDNGSLHTQKDFAYTVTANTVPTFAFGTSLSICKGATVPSLPLTSGNGISGTWNPSSISNQTSGSYSFTPAAGLCASPLTLAVTVNDNATPVFSFDSTLSICAGSTVPALTNTSTNGITGTWNPATVNNQASAIYVFTPGAGQCAITSRLVVTVKPIVVPSVTISTASTSVCNGTSVSFTTNSVNQGTGSWQWKVNNVNAGTGPGFTSTALHNNDKVQVEMTSDLECANPATVSSNMITMQVNPVVQPAITISGTTIVLQGSSSLITSSVVNGGTSPTYQWQDSTTAASWTNIPNATGSTLNYSPSTTGVKLRAVLTSDAPCATNTTATSAALQFAVTIATAVSNLSNNRLLRLYPNPVTVGFTIDSLSLSDRWETLQIKDLQMNTVAAKSIHGLSNVRVDMSMLSKGIYFVALRKKSGEVVYLKLVKL